MSIIARRIPYGLGYIPGRGLRAHTVRGGMGVESALGWYIPPAAPIPATVDPNTLPLCSVTPKYQACRNYIGGSATFSTGAATATSTATTPKPATDWGALATSLTSMFTPKPAAAAPAMSMPAYAGPASSGMSRGTMIAIGLGAAGLLAVVMLTRGK